MSFLFRSHGTRTMLVMVTGFLITVAILTAVCAFGFVRANHMNEDLRNAAQGRANKILLIEDMQSLTQTVVNEIFLMQAREDVSLLHGAAHRIGDFEQDFDFYRRSLIELQLSVEEQQLLQHVDTAFQEARDMHVRTVKFLSARRPDDVAPTAGDLLRMQRRLQVALDRLMEFERTMAFREVANASLGNQDTFRQVLLLFCLALGACTAVALVVLRLVGRSEQALLKEKALAEATLSSIDEGVITIGMTGEVEYINPAAEQLTGVRKAAARGQPLHEVYRLRRLADRSLFRHPAEKPENRIMRCETAGYLLESRSGVEYEVEDSAAPMHDERGRLSGAVLVFRDVTATQEMSRKLKWQTEHDALTGLVNRVQFHHHLEHMIDSARVDGKNHALLFLDLDRFKVINDTCGHAAGDQLLRQVSPLIRSRIRESDMLARLGSDEFGVLLHSCGVEEAMDIARVIRNGIRDYRFVWEDKIFTIGSSIGLAVVDSLSRNAEQMMRAADLACHTAKEGGSDRIQRYDPTHHALERPGGTDMVAQIIRSLDENLFCLYRQKITGLQPHNSADVKYEILLRMIDKDRVIAPGAFLPIAERYGLMKSVDRWVIRQTFAFLQQMRERTELDENILYSVNLSGASINDDDFPDFLRDQMNRYQVVPEEVCFEVTETVAISNLTSAAAFMRSAKELGFKFALDDFGTGMSSFAYLKHLPVDYVKIDGTFVRDVVHNNVDHEIIDAIIRISRTLKIETIAEYVGDARTMALLSQLGVDYAQGYAIGRPGPVALPLTASSQAL